MNRRVLYICYYDISEPLVESQVVAYLRQLAECDYDIHLLTFERRTLSKVQQQELKDRLAEDRITWHHRRYHQRPSLPATLYDIATGAMTAARICTQHKIELIHARSHVPAAMAWILWRLFGYRFIFDYRGMLAEEYVDGGHWREGELKYRLTKGMERVFFRDAGAFVMLTDRIKTDLLRDEPALRLRGEDIQVIPCCVDTSRFHPDEGARARYRQEREWDNRLVITYVGKIGLWYMVKEMAQFFAVARNLDSRFFFQVLTQSEPKPMLDALREFGVPAESYDIRYLPPELLPNVLLASDVGISLIRACNSKRASSPTKMGEYLAAGLPVVLNAGIGDCDELARRNRIGVVLNGFDEQDFLLAARELLEVLDRNDIRMTCREVAEREFSLTRVGGPRYVSVYERLIGKPNARARAAIVETG